MGRPQIITRERVAAAALKILDEDGLDALSLERIAAEMGVRGPSLYHHFADKEEILTEVARLVIGDLDLGREAADWQEWMIDIGRTLYRRVVEHPNAATILIGFMPDAAAVPGFGKGARLLTEAGVDPSVHVLLMEGCEKLVWGWAIQRAAMRLHDDRRLSPTRINRRWPELAVALRDSRWHDEALLEASLRAFIRGVLAEARV